MVELGSGQDQGRANASIEKHCNVHVEIIQPLTMHSFTHLLKYAYATHKGEWSSGEHRAKSPAREPLLNPTVLAWALKMALH